MRNMKDSEVLWLGVIPADWNIVKLKNIFSGFTNGTTATQISTNENIDGLCKVSRIETISTGQIDYSKIGFAQEVDEKYKLNKNDFLVSNINSIPYLGNCAIYNGEDVLYHGMNLLRIIPNKDKNIRFLFYLLKSSCFRTAMQYYCKPAINQASVSSSNIKSIAIAIPEKSVQDKIALFLDKKILYIDNSISRIKSLIDKLKSYKQSIITEAVTKGLNPDVPMKDSGVPWIGMIPEHWEMSIIKREFFNLDGQRRPISAENRTVSETQYDYYGASGVIDKIGDYIFDETLILIGEDGANLAMRNLPLVYIASGKYWVNNHAHILKPCNDNNLYYMAYQLECVDLTNYLTGSTQPKLTQGNLSKIPVAVPTPDEQNKIQSFLDSKCLKLIHQYPNTNHSLPNSNPTRKVLSTNASQVNARCQQHEPSQHERDQP